MNRFLLPVCTKFNWMFLVVATLFLGSCASVEKARYFNESVPAQYPLVDANLDPIIQKADILGITISSLNPDANMPFNSLNVTPAGYFGNTNNTLAPVGYLVDPEGVITFPMLGRLQAAGLTKAQFTDSLTLALKSRKLLVDPIVNVRILNFKVTVLGEVGKPTVVSVANERISLLEAIGMAGDLTLTAKRDNVLLIREEGNKKITRRINLNDESLFRSPYYFLKNNDIIYVEANKAKVQSTSRFTTLLPALLSGFTLLVIIFDRVAR